MSNTQQGNKNAFQHTNIEADGDIHIGDNINNVTVEKPVFSEVNLEAYSEGYYVSPSFTDVFAGIIYDTFEKGHPPFFVITGFFGFDKASFTKHLGLKVLEKLEDRGKNAKVKECFLTSEYYGIATSIKEDKENSIFILNNISPKDVNHNFEKLRTASGKTPIKIILVSTDIPLNAWKNTKSTYWYEVKLNGFYYLGKLVINNADFIYNKRILITYLLKAVDRRSISPYRVQLKNIFEKVVNKDIRTPEQIDVFLDLFALSPVTDEKTILGLITKTKKPNTLIERWFDTLKEEQKLMVLGMTILHGLYEDQFFTALDKIMEKVWKPYNQSLTALDYTDLFNLFHFFYFTNDENSILESKFPNQRFQIFQMLWNSYRRKITATLPALVDLVKESVQPQQTNWSLYGTKEKRQKLRLVIGAVLSDIGRLSARNVEHALLSLAAHDNIGVQTVAAKAIAQWRAPTDTKNDKAGIGEKALFQLLNQWNSDSQLWKLVESIRSILEGNSDQGDHGPSTYTRATIVLTLGYASVYDNPNHLSKDILKLLRGLVKDRSKLVVNRLKETLHILVRNHPSQLGRQLFDTGGELEPIFTERTPCENYIEAVAYGLRDAQKDYPKAIEPILDHWYNYCQQNRPTDFNIKEFTYREKILSVVVITLSVLENTQKLSIYSLKKRMEILILLRKVEKGEQMKNILLNVILHLHEHYKKEIKEFKDKRRSTIPEMTEEERERVVFNFKRNYFRQRLKLNGGDYTIKIQGRFMESWEERAERPETKIEILVAEWMDSDTKPIRNIAYRSMIEFSKLEAEEDRAVMALIEKQNEDNRLAKETNYKPEKVKTGLLDSLIYWDEKSRVLSTLVSTDPEMGDEEIKVLASKLRLLGRGKDAKTVGGGFIKKMIGW